LARLVIVSNRIALPREKGERAGGLAVALREALQERGGLWFGWSGETAEAPAEEPRITRSGRVTYATIDLTKADYEDYYIGFANGVLWPLFHYRLGLSHFRRAAYVGYRRVNQIVAQRLAPLLNPDDVLWVHDYHFIPLATELRRLGVANRIGFFLHIPFPAPEVLLTLPVHCALVGDLLAYDLVGFQTEDDRRALERYLDEEAGARSAEHDLAPASNGGGRVEPGRIGHNLGGRTQIGAFPIGIDTGAFARMAERSAHRPEAARLRDSLSGRGLVIGIDRLDYSKGIPHRLQAFDELLSRWPEHRSRVTLMQIAPVSRGEIAQYRALRREIEGLAGRVNGKFSEFDWTPVRYLNKSFSRQALAGFYRGSRVGFVTPIRDGMNLVAKEYVAAQDPADPGALLLSRFAGAARELRDALIVNPHDVDEMAAALHAALTMPREQRVERWRNMMAVLQLNTVDAWRERFLGVLEQRGSAGR
jgi:trehalose 6-phosphate synthase